MTPEACCQIAYAVPSSLIHSVVSPQCVSTPVRSPSWFPIKIDLILVLISTFWNC
jgi:hypothetical protein